MLAGTAPLRLESVPLGAWQIFVPDLPSRAGFGLVTLWWPLGDSCLVLHMVVDQDLSNPNSLLKIMVQYLRIEWLRAPACLPAGQQEVQAVAVSLPDT